MFSDSPFQEIARSSGAVFRDYGGLGIAESYGDPATEYRAARAAAGLFDLSFRGILRFTGADRTTFLHNLLSNDIEALRPGEGCYATLLTQQSKVVADANVLCLEDSLWLDLDVRFEERARAHLEKYLVADEVEIESRIALDTSLGVYGPRSGEVLRAALGSVSLPEAEHGHMAAVLDGVSLRVSRIPWSVDPGFALIVSRGEAAAVWKALAAGGAPLGLRPAGMAALDAMRIEAGIAAPGIDFDESHLVLEAALERGISFKKGCYLGQEVVERASARGHVNRRRVGLRIESTDVPASSAKILASGAEVGIITSAAFSPTLGAAVAMGYVKRDWMEPGKRVEVETAKGPLAAEVVRLPLPNRPAK
ncbi:MAG: YgfZ/GcvT domain-containing protein [Candidatus Binatia bacterium]